MQHAQQDNSFTVDFQSSALQAVRDLRQDSQIEGDAIRVYIAGKGCDGFLYGVSFSDSLPEDFIFDYNDIIVVIDKEAMPFLTGSVITWVDDERGKGFWVENPNHKKFRGKFFKRKTWRERLLPGESAEPSLGADVSEGASL